MQKVRGANPLSSTFFAAQVHISILKMIFDLLHAGKRMSARRPGSWHGSPRSSDARRRSWPQEATWDTLLGEQAGSNQTICPSSATALREPELPGVIRPSATRCHHRGPYLSRYAMTDRRLFADHELVCRSDEGAQIILIWMARGRRFLLEFQHRAGVKGSAPAATGRVWRGRTHSGPGRVTKRLDELCPGGHA